MVTFSLARKYKQLKISVLTVWHLFCKCYGMKQRTNLNQVAKFEKLTISMCVILTLFIIS
jgi:hypothetical protein